MLAIVYIFRQTIHCIHSSTRLHTRQCTISRTQNLSSWTGETSLPIYPTK